MANSVMNREQGQVNQAYSVEVTQQLTGVSTACLVRYERASIVIPARVGRRRFYQAGDLRRIRTARRLERDLGINLAGVEVVLRLTDQIFDLQRRIARNEAGSV